MTSILTWRLVDDVGAELGAEQSARLKWRQRGVPAKWRLRIMEALAKRSVTIQGGDFDNLDLTPGRIAA